jgi:hypothetical protein
MTVSAGPSIVLMLRVLQVLFLGFLLLIEAAEIGGHDNATTLVATQAKAASAGERTSFAGAIMDRR